MIEEHSMFMALVFVGVILPTVIISAFTLVCIRRHKELKARRAEMLLQDAQDMAMEDYPYTMRGVARFAPQKM